MVFLRINVNCFRCNKSFDKTEVRDFKSVNKEIRYECFTCFKNDKSSTLNKKNQTPHKKKYYCQNCNYKFQSKKRLCPYCNKSNYVYNGEISIKDLL